jgi:Flp pilus assembly protein TadD
MDRRVILLLALLGPGCAPAGDDRLRQFTRDGLQQYQTGAYDRARDSFRSALAVHPGDADLIYNLAQCHDKLGEKPEAERLYNECLKAAPEHAEAHHALLEMMVASNRQAEAARSAHAWLRRRPDLADPYADEGWLCARDGDLDSARVRYQRALDLDPRNPRALVGLARVYVRLNRRGRAAVLYERALAVKPDQPDVRKALDELRKAGVGRPHPD